jgi:hypothetical protein
VDVDTHLESLAGEQIKDAEAGPAVFFGLLYQFEAATAPAYRRRDDLAGLWTGYVPPRLGRLEDRLQAMAALGDLLKCFNVGQVANQYSAFRDGFHQPREAE